MQSATLHIKVEPDIANGLKMLSKRKNVSVGQLVRQAVLASYQLDLASSLNINQKRALEAYQGGYISLSKISEEMGMNIWDMRSWLRNHNIALNNSFRENDVSNA